MRLYRKKLDSVEALKHEKIRLRYERRSTSHSDLNPLAELGVGKVTGVAKEGLIGTAMELFSANSNLQMAMALGKPLLRAMGRRRRAKQSLRSELGLPKKQSFFRKALADVAVSYIVGKALIMGIRGWKMAAKRRAIARLKAKLRT